VKLSLVAITSLVKKRDGFRIPEACSVEQAVLLVDGTEECTSLIDKYIEADSFCCYEKHV